MERLKKNYQYQYVYKNGVSASDKYFTVIAAKSGGGPRFGFSVSKKYGKAVARNRLRRRLKECCRLLSPCIRAGFAFVVIPHAPAEDFSEIKKSLTALFKRHKVWYLAPQSVQSHFVPRQGENLQIYAELQRLRHGGV